LIVGWCGRFLFFVVPRQFSQDICEDEELLNWDKKTKEVKEITPEVLVEERVEMVTPKIMATWAEKERLKEKRRRLLQKFQLKKTLWLCWAQCKVKLPLL